MVTKKWNNIIGQINIKVIECVDEEQCPVWIKFVPIDEQEPIEVAHIVDQPEKVNWQIKNSHFETIIDNKVMGRYPATSAGSVRLDEGLNYIQKEAGSKIVFFPIDMGGSLSAYNYSDQSNQFQIETNKPLWMGYVISGKGSISVTDQ